MIPGDAVALARALQNLLENATRYAPEGDIEIVVTKSGDRAVVEVADRGPGIPVEERERVFLPRVRLQRNAGAPGSGLGLAIVDRIIKEHGGELEVDSMPGKGTKFIMTIKAVEHAKV